MLCVFSLLPPFSACLCLPWLPSCDRGQRNCPVWMTLLSPSLPVPVGCDCSEGKGRRMGWGRGREARKVLVLFLCLTISLTCLSPLYPHPQQTWPPGLVEPARQPAGCLFPASVTDRIFIACMERSAGCKTEQILLLFPNAMYRSCIHLLTGLLIDYCGGVGGDLNVYKVTVVWLFRGLLCRCFYLKPTHSHSIYILLVTEKYQISGCNLSCTWLIYFTQNQPSTCATDKLPALQQNGSWGPLMMQHWNCNNLYSYLVLITNTWLKWEHVSDLKHGYFK